MERDFPGWLRWLAFRMRCKDFIVGCIQADIPPFQRCLWCLDLGDHFRIYGCAQEVAAVVACLVDDLVDGLQLAYGEDLVEQLESHGLQPEDLFQVFAGFADDLSVVES